ncbi:MAG: cadmium-translocating P-type ATPase [Lachnospiraceae bacterium]|nr:cadmium-translocating P-type ATPase [Lachnospiraceae bacterium]
MNKKQKKVLVRILIAAALLVVYALVPWEQMGSYGPGIKLVAYMVPYLVIGWDILRKAWKGIGNRQVFDENFLMAVATLGAIGCGIAGTGDYVEAVAVMLFYQVGELFQSYAVGKSRRNISELMDIRPDYANCLVDGNWQKVDPEEVAIGSRILVNPGEKVPIDGIVRKGISTLNTAALTGESLPRDVVEGNEIISGCINMTGVLEIETTKEFGESTVSKILELVENASSRKSKSEEFISKFARVYTPVVCYLALALALLPPVVLWVMGEAPSFGVWVYRALTFLVISCPCALVISIPLTFFAGIGGASREGILVKGSVYLENLSKVTHVVFDKTGTMTQGVFEVVGIHHNSMEEKELLRLAAHAEAHSSHPISKSLLKAYGGTLEPTILGSVEEIAGEGVVAQVENKTITIGNSKLMKRYHIAYTDCHSVGTIVHIAVDGEYAGHIVIADVEKPTAKEAIRKLHQAGIAKTIMLTGDAKNVAEVVAKDLGIDEVYGELLPATKVEKLEEILKQNQGRGKVAFVGDGINDAPVLSRADLGIAMGAMGSDAAIEAADVVLMDDDPLKIAQGIRLSRKCLRIVYENIYFAIGIKVLCLLLGALGIANMWAAIFADVGVMILAVCNAIRALWAGK